MKPNHSRLQSKSNEISNYWKIFDYGFRVVFFIFLYVLMNFDKNLNLDYSSYESNYDLKWQQFEPGFEFILSLYRGLKFEFSDVWTSLLLTEVLLISILYKDRITFYFAIPNLYFLSQGLLGTQVRFAFAVLFFLVLFKALQGKKYSNIILALPVLFHVGVIIPYSITLYIKFFFNTSLGIIRRSSLKWLLLFGLSTAFAAFSMDHFLSSAGYDYYVGTKYQEGKSLSSLLYIMISFIIALVFASKDNKSPYRPFLYLGLFVSLFSIIFNQSSVISGRFTLVYVLIEPFIIAHIFSTYAKKIKAFPIFLILCAIVYAKTLTVSVSL